MSKRLPLICLLMGPLPALHAEAPRRDRYGDPLPPGAIARLGTTRLRHFGRVFDVAYSADGKILVSYGEDRRTRLWEAASGRPLRELPGYVSVAFSPCSKLPASLGGDNTTQPLAEAIGMHGRILGYSPDGRILAYKKVVNPSPSKAPSEEAISLWDIAARKVLRTWTMKASTYASAFAPDGRTLAIGTNVWALTGDTQKEGKGRVQGENTALLSLWDTATGKERWHSERRLDAVLSIAFSADGKTLASAGDRLDPEKNRWHGQIRFWSAATGKELRELPGLVNRVECVRFSGDGKYLASICGSGPTILWDMTTANGPRRVWEVADNGWKAAFSPDSRRFAWSTRQAIRASVFLPMVSC